MSFPLPIKHARASALVKFNTPKSLRGARKWFGACQSNKSFNDTNVTTAANWGGGSKLEAEAPYNAVRLIWISRSTNAIVGSKSLIGVHETMSTANTATRFQPMINGVTASGVVAAPNVLGWRAVTWNGQPTVDHPAATTAAQVRVSDWMDLTSVPRTDGGTRPILLTRNENPVTGAGPAIFSAAGIDALQTPKQANRGRVLQLFTDPNMVSNPSAVAGTMGLFTYEVFPEFRYNVPSLSVCGVGDSILQSEGLGLTGVVSSWGARACYDVSTPERPVDWVNCGSSGKPFSDFWARFNELVDAGYVPDVLVVMPLSVNDYSTDMANLPYYIERGKSRAQQVYEYAKAKGIRNIVFIPLMPYNPLSAPSDLLRKAYNNWLENFASAMDCPFLDFRELGNGATPERWLPGYNAFNDGLHPNERAVETVMAPALSAILANCA